MRLLNVTLFAAVAFLAGAALGAPVDKGPDPVEVTNFPVVQEVAGAVEVTNLPDVQDVNVTNPPTCSAGPEARYQLVGFTSSALLGDSGVLGMTIACQQEFADSRMCSSVEVMETVAVPLDLTGVAWVRPSFSPLHDPGTQAAALDASGFKTLVSLFSCNKTSSINGFTVLASGRFAGSRCTNLLAVACCALVP